MALFRKAKNAIDAVLIQKGKKGRNLRLLPDDPAAQGSQLTLQNIGEDVGQVLVRARRVQPCRGRRGEGYEARDDKKQEKAPALICAGTSTSARSAGSFRGRRLALFRRAKNAVDAVSI